MIMDDELLRFKKRVGPRRIELHKVFVRIGGDRWPTDDFHVTVREQGIVTVRDLVSDVIVQAYNYTGWVRLDHGYITANNEWQTVRHIDVMRPDEIDNWDPEAPANWVHPPQKENES